MKKKINLYVNDTDEAVRFLESQGVESWLLHTNQPGGERLAYFLDPEGNPMQVTVPIKD